MLPFGNQKPDDQGNSLCSPFIDTSLAVVSDTADEAEAQRNSKSGNGANGSPDSRRPTQDDLNKIHNAYQLTTENALRAAKGQHPSKWRFVAAGTVLAGFSVIVYYEPNMDAGHDLSVNAHDKGINFIPEEVFEMALVAGSIGINGVVGLRYCIPVPEHVLRLMQSYPRAWEKSNNKFLKVIRDLAVGVPQSIVVMGSSIPSFLLVSDGPLKTYAYIAALAYMFINMEGVMSMTDKYLEKIKRALIMNFGTNAQKSLEICNGVFKSIIAKQKENYQEALYRLLMLIKLDKEGKLNSIEDGVKHYNAIKVIIENIDNIEPEELKRALLELNTSGLKIDKGKPEEEYDFNSLYMLGSAAGGFSFMGYMLVTYYSMPVLFGEYTPEVFSDPVMASLLTLICVGPLTYLVMKDSNEENINFILNALMQKNLENSLGNLYYPKLFTFLGLSCLLMALLSFGTSLALNKTYMLDEEGDYINSPVLFWFNTALVLTWGVGFNAAGIPKFAAMMAFALGLLMERFINRMLGLSNDDVELKRKQFVAVDYMAELEKDLKYQDPEDMANMIAYCFSEEEAVRLMGGKPSDVIKHIYPLCNLDGANGREKYSDTWVSVKTDAGKETSIFPRFLDRSRKLALAVNRATEVDSVVADKDEESARRAVVQRFAAEDPRAVSIDSTASNIRTSLLGAHVFRRSAQLSEQETNSKPDALVCAVSTASGAVVAGVTRLGRWCGMWKPEADRSSFDAVRSSLQSDGSGDVRMNRADSF